MDGSRAAPRTAVGGCGTCRRAAIRGDPTSWRRSTLGSGISCRRRRHAGDLADAVRPRDAQYQRRLGHRAAFFAELVRALPEAGSMRLFGFDHSIELLAAARARNFDNAVFDYVDLNQPPGTRERLFDVVTCFETLEHVGNVPNAIETLLASCKPGGTLLISVPNELGLPGLKYGARKVFRRRPYESFFRQQSESRYVWRLLTGRSNESPCVPGPARRQPGGLRLYSRRSQGMTRRRRQRQHITSVTTTMTCRSDAHCPARHARGGDVPDRREISAAHPAPCRWRSRA